MPSVHEQLTEQFRQWELRGRGWQVYQSPVTPEPPFRPFDGHFLPPQPAIDDGRRPTIFSSFVAKLSQSLSGKSQPPPAIEEEPEPEPEVLIRDSLVELQTFLPANLDISREVFAQFLSSLSRCHEPVTFELLGLEPRITAQFAVHPRDVPMASQQLHAFFHDAVFTPQQNTLEQAWNETGDADIAIVEFGLEKEFMRSLATGKLDPFVGIIGVLAELHPDELGLFQVIFQPIHHPWAESIVRSVTHSDGKSFFVNAPELVPAAREKTWHPLYAAVVRIAAKSAEPDRAWEIARHLASALSVFANPTGNELIPLRNDDYAFEDHIEDVLRRQSRRSGMLLSSEELISFVHFPSPAVTSPKLQRQTTTTKRAPGIVLNPAGLLLGQNEHAGESLAVRLTPEQRVRHLHAIGASGTGKSTLLFNLIRQDIENGEGVALLDPHGDLVDKLLGIIPESRVEDVILLDPSDEEYSIGFNILSAHSELEKNLLASDLVSVFQRLSNSWGDQMGSVLNNAIRAFLESSRGGTLADLRRFLLEPAYRNEFLQTVSDPELLYYWQKGFAQLSGNKSIGPVLTRLETFLSPKPIRYMVSQPVNRLDFSAIMDTGKIFLAKLAQGEIGKENSYLLGSLLVSKFQQMAMSRQRQAVRKDYWLYVDEFQNFITPSMTEILTGARKYRLGLILAHQELRQLERDREVASAVLSNCHTRVVFRVGDDDARKLSDGFAFFEARDLQNLEIGKAVCRVERSDYDFNLSVPFPADGDLGEAEDRSQQVITASRKKYGTPRAEIELALRGLQEQPTKRDDFGGPSDSLHPHRRPPQPTPTAPPIVTEAVPLPKPAVPKTSEVPKEVEKEPAKPEVPRDLGRGGEQHRSLQERIQTAAHALGFLADVERQLAQDSTEAADLTLRKGDLAIAVEIAVTTTIDHEFGNVKKCLAAGFGRVAVVSPKPEKLGAIAEAVKAGMDSEAVAKVSYHTPEAFIAELGTLAKQFAPTEPSETTTRGYKVRSHGPTLTEEERRLKEEVALRVMSEAMKNRNTP
jgi:type IV secretion system coupling TraD/TrwB family protein